MSAERCIVMMRDGVVLVIQVTHIKKLYVLYLTNYIHSLVVFPSKQTKENK